MRKLLKENPKEFLLKFGIDRKYANNYVCGSHKVPWKLKWEILYTLAPKTVKQLMDDINEKMRFDKDI